MKVRRLFNQKKRQSWAEYVSKLLSDTPIKLRPRDCPAWRDNTFVGLTPTIHTQSCLILNQIPIYDNWTAFTTLDFDWHWECSVPAQSPAGTQALEERQLKLSIHYYLKTRACVDNPARHALHEFDWHMGPVHHDVVIYSDSMSCLQTIEGEDTENPFIGHIMKLLWLLSDKGTHVRFCWIPSHCGIEGY